MERKRRSIAILLLGVAMLLGGVFALGAISHAATPISIEDVGSSIGLGTADLKAVVINIIRWILGILTLVAVSLIIYGGILWMTSGGDERRIDKAKRVILNAVVGLVIVLIAWAIVFFVTGSLLGNILGGGTSGDGPPGCCLPPGGSDVGFEIRSITTDCGSPPDYRNDVFRCSAVQVTFNHQVDASTVQAAVDNGTLVIKQCADSTCADSGLTIPAGSAIDAGLTGPARQAYSADAPSGTKGEWVAKADNSGKTVTFYHDQKLFDPNLSFHVSIPTTIKDVGSSPKPLSNCQISTGVPLPGCTPDPGVGTPTRFTWTMNVGTNTDTSAPKRQSSYPTSAYKAPGTPSGAPDENVARELVRFWISYDQAIRGTIDQSHNATPADRLNNTIAIIPFTPNSSTPDPEDQTAQGDPVNPNDFVVTVSPDGQSIEFQVKPGKRLEKFQWYRIQVKGVRDLCNNLQAPEPFSWVFETNDVVAGIADHFPRNDTGLNGSPPACGNTPIFIRYTTSMYDITTSSCAVPAGFVTSGSISPAPSTARTFSADPSCTVYSFSPPPPMSEPLPSGELSPGTTYRVGVDNRYVTDDAGGTLRFGSGSWGDAALGAWKFKVDTAGNCINPPVITSIDPPSGTDGQCITVSGYNFDRDTPGQHGGDQLVYEGSNVPASGVLSWSDGQIAAEAPAGPAALNKKFKVSADFPAPFGTLTSPEFDWEKKSGSASTGPCLASVTQNSGYNLDNVTLDGRRFDPTSSTKQVRWTGSALVIQSSPPGWTDTQISSSVPPKPPVASSLLPPDPNVQVRVRNNAGTSNPVNFDLKNLVIPPGTPEPPVVVDLWPDCGLSCTNADVGARLAYPSGAALTLDATTLTTGTAIIKHCQTDACTSYTGADITPVIVNDGPPANVLHFPPAASLLPNTAYRVVLKGTIKDSTGTSLGQLNFDAGSGANDSFSWIFKTQGGAGGCRLGRVDVAPNPDLFTSAGEQHNYFSATGYTEPNSCSANGQPIDPTTLSWSWASDPNKATVAPNANPWGATVKAVAETVPGPATTVSSTATEASSGRVRTGSSQVTINFSHCEDDIDCASGGVCGGSTCDEITHQCSPVITSISPVQGAPGTWIDINGCYFGSYQNGTCNGGSNAGVACNDNHDCNSKDCQGGSAAIFTGDKRGLWPNPGLCGVPSVQWGDRKIRSEVPDRNESGLTAASGPVVVQRYDGVRSAASGQSFIVDPAVIVPGICTVSPANGSEGSGVTLQGQQFGNTQGAADKVTFYQEKDVATGEYSLWSNTKIVCTAPSGISNNTDPAYESPSGHAWGGGEIAVTAGGQTSNVVDFNVVAPGCQVCTSDPVCGTGNSCGYSGCCTSNPSVLTSSPGPGQTNVCRNAVISATFSRDMDPSTINASTVSIYKKTEVIPLPATIAYDAPSRTVRIYAPLLEGNKSSYKVVFTNVRATDGGLLSSYLWGFTTVDSDSLCGINHIDITPPQWSFSKIAQPRQFTAHPISDSGIEVSKIPGVYDWTWKWSVTDDTVADFSAPPGDAPTATVESKPKKGTTFLKAEVRPTAPPHGLTSPVAGLATLNSTTCENLWLGSQFQDAANNCLPGSGDCSINFHFNLSYCLDGGLPNLDQKTITGKPGSSASDGALLKEFLFKQSAQSTLDAIGIRIYSNNEGLSASEWYKKYATKPGSVNPTTVDGYDAVRDGRTVYVSATDFDETNPADPHFVPRIFLMSITQNAPSGIQNIFNQLLENWYFNNNVNGVCHNTPLYPATESDKTCVQRDLKRLSALSDITQALRTYKTKNGFYPKIESGSFLPQLSFSVWPSWRDRLGGDLGISPPADPKNKIENCPSGQAQDGTCWNETNKKFVCLPDASAFGSTVQSHILGYQGAVDGSTAKLFANLEYHGTGNWINGASSVCSAPSTCQCFNYSFGP